MRLFACSAGAVIIILVCSSACLAEGARFREIGCVDGPSCDVYGVSAYGNAVVGSIGRPSGGHEAFIWTEANEMVRLGGLYGFCDSEAFGVSCDGSFAVGYSYSNDYFNTVPCRWSGPNDILRLGQQGSYLSGYAFKISADGTTVVGSIDDVAFRWTEATGMQSLGHLPGGNGAAAWSVSADGHVIVGGSYGPGNKFEAFRWTEATGMVGLGGLQDGNSEAYDISEDGLVVVGWSGGQAFIWSEAEGMRGIGSGLAWGVSGDGAVVVGWDNNCASFIWDANHEMQNLKNVLENAYGLDIPFELGCYTDISADGRTIAGSGGGGWIAILEDPPPSVKLTVHAESNGLGINTVTPSVGEHIYYKNWPVVIKADTFKNCPDVYRFNHWVGDVTEPNSATITLVMTEDKIVTAVYNVDQRRCGDECHPILQGDLNKDCYINFEDFAIYCAHWLSCTHPDCD